MGSLEISLDGVTPELRDQDTLIRHSELENMKRRRIIIALLTLSFITSVTTIVALMITALHLTTGPTPNPTTTVSTGDTKTSTTSTTTTQGSTTTTALSTTTTNLDELLCDDWLCNWKGDSLIETLPNIPSEALCLEACLDRRPDCAFYTFIFMRGLLECHLLTSCQPQSPLPNCPSCGSGPK